MVCFWNTLNRTVNISIKNTKKNIYIYKIEKDRERDNRLSKPRRTAANLIGDMFVELNGKKGRQISHFPEIGGDVETLDMNLT